MKTKKLSALQKIIFVISIIASLAVVVLAVLQIFDISISPRIKTALPYIFFFSSVTSVYKLFANLVSESFVIYITPFRCVCI